MNAALGANIIKLVFTTYKFPDKLECLSLKSLPAKSSVFEEDRNLVENIKEAPALARKHDTSLENLLMDEHSSLVGPSVSDIE